MFSMTPVKQLKCSSQHEVLNKHLQSWVGATQCSLGVGGSDEAGDEGGPAQRKLELDIFSEIRAEGGEAEVIGQLEGGGRSRELLLDGQRQQRTDAV